MIKRIIFLPLLLLFAKSVAAQEMIMPAEQVIDKIQGGLLRQNLGVLNGLPYEFTFIEQRGDVRGYVPSLPEGARTDDDTDFEWVYIYQMHIGIEPLLTGYGIKHTLCGTMEEVCSRIGWLLENRQQCFLRQRLPGAE